MMQFSFAVAAVVVALSGLSGAHAQSIASVGGPKELPPANYSGQQYVDSRGCVFLRAGYGGQTNWVPRVNAQRRALCGFPPTFAKVTIEIAEDLPAPIPPVVSPAPAEPAPQPPAPAVDPAIYTPAPYTPPSRKTVQVETAPTLPVPQPRMGSVATTRATAPAPYTEVAPSRSYETAASVPGQGQIGCFTSAPVAEVVRLRSGGTVVVCTRGDGGMSGWRSPIYPAGSPPGVALNDPFSAAPVARTSQKPVLAAQTNGSRVATRMATATAPLPPKGYKLAWTDDRLNPLRGQGTAAGQAAQDRIWTRDVPAKLVVADVRGKARVTVSTKAVTRPVPEHQPVKHKAAAPGALVQVGTFGVAGNAADAAARLSALGLPVAMGRTTKGGQSLQIVFAGPFASAAEAQSALSAARRAGFSDAFVR